MPLLIIHQEVLQLHPGSDYERQMEALARTATESQLKHGILASLEEEADGAGEERAGAASASARGGTSSSSRGADSPLQYDGPRLNFLVSSNHSTKRLKSQGWDDLQGTARTSLSPSRDSLPLPQLPLGRDACAQLSPLVAFRITRTPSHSSPTSM